MKNSKKRQLSLCWWINLSPQIKYDLIKTYKPNWTIEMINKSSSTIEQIWNKTINKEL